MCTKVRFYGILGTSRQWFSSYLMNRKQLVDCYGTFSTLTNLTTGVPQGSILGPLLSTIYMNDIHEASENCHAILYADDTSLFNSLCYFTVALNGTKLDKYALSEIINTELSNIQEWLNKWLNKLSLNVNKTKYMMVHHHQRNIDDLKVSDIFHNSLLKLFYKYKSVNLPHYIMLMFSDATNTHNYIQYQVQPNFKSSNIKFVWKWEMRQVPFTASYWRNRPECSRKGQYALL